MISLMRADEIMNLNLLHVFKSTIIKRPNNNNN